MDNILKHLYAEAVCRPSIKTVSLLNEMHGYIPNLDRYVSAFSQAFKNTLDEAIEDYKSRNFPGRAFHFSLEEDIFDFKTFFDKAYFEINVGLIDSKLSYTGQYKSGKSGPSSSGYKVVISLSITGNYDDVIKGVKSEFAHELTHAYDDYNRKIKGKNDVLDTGFKSGSQSAGDLYAWNYNEDNIEKAISSIIYHTDPSETNAYIGMIKSELDYDTIKHCTSAEDLNKAIRQTEGYNHYYEVIYSLNKLKNITDPEIQQKVIDVFNKTRKHPAIVNAALHIMDTPVKTFKKAIAIMSQKVDKFARKFNTQVSKMAYDVYSEVNGNVVSFNESVDKIKDLMRKINK